MSIRNDLKKEGIEVICQLDSNLTYKIIESVAKKIVETFPDFYLNEDRIINKFSELTMYKAKMPDGMAEANYYYKNTSIYFNEHIDDEDLEEFAIHECIHFYQEVTDDDELIRMGLCNYTSSKPRGLGLNEAAVQYISAKIIGIIPDFEKYYGITLYTPSPSYYPLECALLNELVFFTGEDILCKSTLFSISDFKNYIIDHTSENTYEKIQTSFDNILKYEEQLIKLNNKIAKLPDGSSKIDSLTKLSDKYKSKIFSSFLNTQNLIITEFFGDEFDNITNMEELDNFRKRLDDFKAIIGVSDNYTFFDDYYLEMMNKSEHKCNVLENGGEETALIPVQSNKLEIFFNKFFNLFRKKNLKKSKQ